MTSDPDPDPVPAAVAVAAEARLIKVGTDERLISWYETERMKNVNVSDMPLEIA